MTTAEIWGPQGGSTMIRIEPAMRANRVKISVSTDFNYAFGILDKDGARKLADALYLFAGEA